MEGMSYFTSLCKNGVLIKQRKTNGKEFDLTFAGPSPYTTMEKSKE